jgi:hypothetical protein
MVLAFLDTVDETPQPLVVHPHTSQARKLRNHIQSIVSNTVTDSDIPYYPRQLKLDILLRHQPPQEKEELPPFLPMDPPEPDPKVKQIELDESVLMQVAPTYKRKETLVSAPGKVPDISNLTFEYSE